MTKYLPPQLQFETDENIHVVVQFLHIWDKRMSFVVNYLELLPSLCAESRVKHQ